MEAYLIIGGALGALLRKVSEWAGDRSLATVQGVIVETVLGAVGALLAVKLGWLPSAVTGPMLASPAGALAVAIATTYVPLDLVRRFGDLATGQKPALSRVTAWSRWR